MATAAASPAASAERRHGAPGGRRRHRRRHRRLRRRPTTWPARGGRAPRRAGRGGGPAVGPELGLRPPAGTRSARGPAHGRVEPHLARARDGARRRTRVDAGRQPRPRRDRGADGAVRADGSASAREFGLDTRLVRGRDLESVVPGMQGTWVGGMYTPSDGHAEPTKATEAFAHAAAARGALLRTGTVVRASSSPTAAVAGCSPIGTRSGPRPRGVRGRRLVGAAPPDGRAAPPAAAGPGDGGADHARAPDHARRRLGPGSGVPPAAGTDASTSPPGARRTTTSPSTSFRHVRLFLPNYWKNRKLFRFHVGAAALARSRPPLAQGRARDALTSDQDPDPAEPDKVRSGPRGVPAPLSRRRRARHRAELGGLHRRHARRDPGAGRGDRTPGSRRRHRLQRPRLRDGAHRGAPRRRAGGRHAVPRPPRLPLLPLRGGRGGAPRSVL